MAELLLEQFMPEARVIANASDTLQERAELLRDLEIEEPAGYPAGAVFQAIHRNKEPAVVFGALQKAQTTPDTNISLSTVDSLDGWYVTDLEGSVHYGHEQGKEGMQKYEGDPRPVVLAAKGVLYVCERQIESADGAEAVVRKHLYVPATASTKGDLDIAFGLAVAAAKYGLELAS